MGWQWTSMLPLWQWLLLLAVPPALVALYFLKLRRQPLVVPSTYLWRKSIEDLHVNSLWQRLRRSLLLLLQLLLLLLLIFALLNPTWQSSQLSGNYFIFLIDNSASMSATDTKAEGSATRLDLAKSRVQQMLSGLGAGDSVMLISFSDVAETVQQYTTQHRELQRHLAAIAPSERTTSIAAALRLAAGLANPGKASGPRSDAPAAAAAASAVEGRPATLVIVSDFRFADVADFSVGNLAPKLVAVGRTDARNVAITSFAVRRYEDRPKDLEAVARLQNFSDTPFTFKAALTMGSNVLDASEVALAAGAQKTVSFPLSNLESGVLKLRIDPADELAVDNTAWAVVNPPRRGRVLFVSPGCEALRLGLSTGNVAQLADVASQPPSYLLTDEYVHGADAGTWDLIIYDRCAPKAMPRANTFFVGRLPPGDRWKAGEKLVNPTIVDTERTHPLLQFVEVGNFIIEDVSVIKPPSGGVSLFDVAEGSIFAIAPREGFQDAVLGFEIDASDAQGQITKNTDWPLRQSFPLFVKGLLAYLGSASVVEETQSLRPGQQLQVASLSPMAPAEVLTPGGRRVTLTVGQDQKLLFTGTDAVGVYEIQQGKAPARQVAVNLFSPAESEIQVQPQRSVVLGDFAASPSRNWQTMRRGIVKWLLLLALAVLMIEWYIYNRRVYV